MLEYKIAKLFQTLPKKKPQQFFKYPKKLLNLWATFVRKLVAKNFQKMHKLVTLTVSAKSDLCFPPRYSWRKIWSQNHIKISEFSNYYADILHFDWVTQATSNHNSLFQSRVI